MTVPLRRRRFLQVLGAAALASACGTDGSASSGAATGGDGATAARSVPVALFNTDRVIVAGSVQRLPFAVFDADRLPRRDAALPRTVTVAISAEGAPVSTETVELHGLDLPFPYYPLRTALPEPGLYDLEIALDDGPARMVVQAFDPAEVAVPRPGEALPVAPTPTVDDLRGVDPICTRFEPCPFHATSLDQALGRGPVALLVGTPAYCQTGVCGPMLEQLIAAAPGHPTVTIIHAEVYANPREVDGNLADPAIRTAPVTEAMRLDFEPVLFVVGSDGIVSDRLDNVYDTAELERALAEVS